MKMKKKKKETGGGSLCSRSRLFKVVFNYYFGIDGTNTEDKNIFG
jgi:hypothetical protein